MNVFNSNNIKQLRSFSFIIMLLTIIPVYFSCADEQFEDDEKYERFGEIDSFPMRLITSEALQGVWNSQNSKITFINDSFASTGSVLGTISGKYKITGNTIRVYKNDERIGYFPIVHFKRYMDIRYNGSNHRFVREGDIPNAPEDDDNGNNHPKDSDVIPLDDSGFFGTWAVSKASIDGEAAYLDVNWHNSRLILSEDYTFSASYWLGIVEKSGSSNRFTDLGGSYKIDKNRNITFYSSGGKQIMKYVYKDAEVKKYRKYWNPQTGEETWEEKIVNITYEVEKDGHHYVITFYRT